MASTVTTMLPLTGRCGGSAATLNAHESNSAGTEANLESLEQIAHTLPAQRYAMPDGIAAAALYLASNEAGFVHGITLPVDGGYLAT